MMRTLPLVLLMGCSPIALASQPSEPAKPLPVVKVGVEHSLPLASAVDKQLKARSFRDRVEREERRFATHLHVGPDGAQLSCEEHHPATPAVDGSEAGDQR